MGKSVSEAMKPMARPARRALVVGKDYRAKDLAAIKGWSNVTEFGLTSKLWQEFAKEKDLEENRKTLMAMMVAWGEKMAIEVDTTIYFSDEMMKHLIGLVMVVGGHGAQYDTCEVGNSFLACMSEDKVEKSARKKRDKARELTRRTRTYNEELSLEATEPRYPPNDYIEAKLAMGTFAALQHALVGTHSPWYLEILRCRRIFDEEAVKEDKKAFTGMQARVMAWGIHCAMVEFFGTRLTPDQLLTPKEAPWPTSDLMRVADVIRNGTLVHIRSFPASWNEAPAAAAYEPTGNPYQLTKTPKIKLERGLGGGGTGGSPTKKVKIKLERGTERKSETGPVTHCHSRVKDLLKHFHVKFKGRANMKHILDASRKRWNHLPKLQKFTVEGKNRLCYTWVFGHCPWGDNCEFEHPPAREFDNDFIDRCHNVIKPGLVWIFENKPAEGGQ